MKAELTDIEILTLLKSSDQSSVNRAFRYLYKNHYGSILVLVNKNGGNEEYAKDIFQDGLIAFYNQLVHKDLVLSCSIKTYLYSVCRNLWLAYLRKAKRQEALKDTDEYIKLEENELQKMINSERSLTISHIIGKMGEDCQKILLYFYFEKKSIKQITALLQTTNDQATRTKKSRCMQRLRNMVQNSTVYKNLLK